MHEDPTTQLMSPLARMNWLELIGAIDASIHTLQTGVPDPLWWGSARAAYDAQVNDIIAELQQAKREILSTMEHPG